MARTKYPSFACSACTKALRLLAILALSTCFCRTASAGCDLCSLYTGSVLETHRQGLTLGINTQFTSFNSYKGAGNANLPVDEWIQSSITNVVIGYAFASPFRVEAVLPFIDRHYRAADGAGAERNHETGIGDIALVGRFTAVDKLLGESSLLRVELLAGLELPTGDSDRLGKEGEEGHHAHMKHDYGHDGGDDDDAMTARSGIHGHDLALGSGSLDALLGVNVFLTSGRVFGTAGIQYDVRGRGDHGYRSDNGLHYYSGVGAYLWLEEDSSAALEARLAGETKGNDEQQGATVPASGATTLYAGPHLHMTKGEHFRVSLGGQLPVLQNVSGLMLMPDYRLLASVGWHF